MQSSYPKKKEVVIGYLGVEEWKKNNYRYFEWLRRLFEYLMVRGNLISPGAL